MSTRLTLTAIYEQVEEGWVQARLAELPAVITAAPTLEEAKDWLGDALSEYLLSLSDPDLLSLPDEAATSRLPLDIVIQAA